MWAKHSALHAAANRVGRAGGRGNHFAGGLPDRSNGSIMGMTRRQHGVLLAGVVLLSALPVQAERKPVSAQIQLPHNYYYREMYLPQLTSGPSALTFSPDGKELVYSMVVRFGAKPSVVTRRANSPTRGATTTSRIGHMMVDILYSLATRTTLSSCGSSICKPAGKSRSLRMAISISSRAIHRMTVRSLSFPPLIAAISIFMSQRSRVIA